MHLRGSLVWFKGPLDVNDLPVSFRTLWSGASWRIMSCKHKRREASCALAALVSRGRKHKSKDWKTLCTDLLALVVWEKRAAWERYKGPSGNQSSYQKEVEAPSRTETVVMDR